MLSIPYIKKIAKDCAEDASDDILGLWLLFVILKREISNEKEMIPCLLEVIKEMMLNHEVKVGSMKRIGDDGHFFIANKNKGFDIKPWDNRKERYVNPKGYFRVWDVDNDEALKLLEGVLKNLGKKAPNIPDNIEFVAPGNPYLDEAKKILE